MVGLRGVIPTAAGGGVQFFAINSLSVAPKANGLGPDLSRCRRLNRSIHSSGRRHRVSSLDSHVTDVAGRFSRQIRDRSWNPSRGVPPPRPEAFLAPTLHTCHGNRLRERRHPHDGQSVTPVR
jgi:hypothetical protein